MIRLVEDVSYYVKDFENALKNLVTSNQETTGNFFKEAIEETKSFTSKVKDKGLEVSNEVTVYLDGQPDDKKEAEIEAKEDEMGTPLFNFIVLNHPDDIEEGIDELKEDISTKLQACETKINQSWTQS